MLFQIETSTVGMPYTFYPTLGGVNLGIPAVNCIVCHFGAEVLPEPDVLFLYAHFAQELHGFNHELSQCRIGH